MVLGFTYFQNIIRFFLMCMIFILFNYSLAYSAGSSSSDEKKETSIYPPAYYKAVKLVRAEKFSDALVILEKLLFSFLSFLFSTTIWSSSTMLPFR
mgnify:CR=1 FL=1